MPLQAACGPQCALVLGRRRAHAKQRVDLKARRNALMSLSDHHKATQAIFNKWIRLRDTIPFDLPCPSCGRLNNNLKWDAGHYLTRGGHPEHRYNPVNVAKQCTHCNRWNSGKQSEFRKGLVMRYGEAAVLELEGPSKPRKYTVEELQAIQKTCKLEIKRLESLRNQPPDGDF